MRQPVPRVPRPTRRPRGPGRPGPRALTLLTTGLLCLPALAATPATAADARTSAAAGFLTGELTRLGHLYPSPTSPGNPDTGLTAEAVLALGAVGAGGPQRAETVRRLRAAWFHPSIDFSGGIARYLLVALEHGTDPRDWGTDAAGRPVDLVARLRATLDGHGRYTHRGQAADTSNVFDQAYAVLASQRYATHPDARDPEPAADRARGVAYLLRQQCPSGGFRLAPPPGGEAGSCPATAEGQVSADTTGVALGALATLGGQRAAVDRAVAWLTRHQDAGGGFGMDSGSPAAIRDSLNANSTGLAGWALKLAGADRPASRASGWLGTLQLQDAGLPQQLRGAVAYTPADLARIRADPAGYWARASSQDRLRRATVQALPGLTAAPTAPRPTPEPTPRPTPTVTVTRTARPIPVATPTVSPGPLAPLTPLVPFPTAGPDPGPAGRPDTAAQAGRPVATSWLASPWGLAVASATGLLLAGASYLLLTGAPPFRRSRKAKP